MSHVDNVNLANKKNRVGKSRLETELNRINREQLIEMRMHNNTKQRFKNRYAKLDVFNEKRGSEASDVVMFETHNPGFCYRRNGDCRIPQVSVTSSSVDMQDLHRLLFTNGEIDIDKVICLYLLTAHKTETLTPPPKSQKTTFLSREQSPLERLVDRSKKRSFDSTLLKTLPLYILEVDPLCHKDPIRDARLLSKLIINDKILQIVSSVKMALEVSNPDTVAKFLSTITHKERIHAVMSKAKMQDFCMSLYGQNIISSCESFYLKLPQPENVVLFQIGIPCIEDFVRAIRRNILQMPNTYSWNVYYKKPSTSNLNTEVETGEILYENPNPETVSIQTVDSTYDASLNVPPLHIAPKILKNMQKGFSDMKYEDLLSPASSNASKIDKMNFDKLANLLTQKVKKESQRDYTKMMEELPLSTIAEVDSEKRLELLPTRCSLKQTTCEACMQKWKSPLPSPKTSKIKKVPLPVLKDTSYFSSRSAQKISNIIEEEVRKYETINAAAKPELVPKLSNRVYRNLAKGNPIMNTSVEIIDLDDLELAKIRQEIKENETRKKFAKFMSKTDEVYK